MKILFVCTGNICRSPTAEGVFRHLVKQSGLEEKIEVDSAAINNYHVGESPDQRSVACAKSRGISMAGQYARQVIPQDFHDFDLILAMDNSHLSALRAFKQGKAEVALFLEYADHPEYAEVPDPYYGDQVGFDHVLNLVEEASSSILGKLNI